MTQFIKKSLIYLFPFVIVVIILEVFITYYPSTFNTKSGFIKNNKDVELLILGSSHMQNALNPEYMNVKSANLAYGWQDIKLDEALFSKYVNELYNLKYLFLELDYHRLEDSNSTDFYRLAWYYRYYGLEIEKLPLIKKISLYASSPSFFQLYLKNTFLPKGEKSKLNMFGYNLVDSGVFSELNFNKILIEKTAESRLKNRHSSISLNNYNSNKKLLNKIISICNKKEIKVFLCATPLYYTYTEREIFEKKLRRNNYIDSILKYNNYVYYFNFESDSRFLVTDYKNDDHLNPKGGEKYTKLLNIKLDSIINLNKNKATKIYN